MSASASGKENISSNPKYQVDASFLSEISSATLVKLLIRKGILTPAEIIKEERQTRIEEDERNQTNSHASTKRSKFKHWASKHRWSRRLTHLLFGWNWRRSRHYHYTSSQQQGKTHS